MVAGWSSSFNRSGTDSNDTPDDFLEEIATADESSNRTPCRNCIAGERTMGLDLALGVVILIAAFRGWFQGFIGQAVRLAGLVACVYLADRVRDYARPYVTPYLSSIEPDLVDRLLWWVSAVATYIVLVGAAMVVIRMTRRPEIPGISQSARNDQFAGFLLGGAKGSVVAAFVAAAILRYGSQPIETVPWAAEQVKTSLAVHWTETYQPVPRIWSSRRSGISSTIFSAWACRSRARDLSHQRSKGCRTSPRSVRPAAPPIARPLA